MGHHTPDTTISKIEKDLVSLNVIGCKIIANSKIYGRVMFM